MATNVTSMHCIFLKSIITWRSQFWYHWRPRWTVYHTFECFLLAISRLVQIIQKIKYAVLCNYHLFPYSSEHLNLIFTEYSSTTSWSVSSETIGVDGSVCKYCLYGIRVRYDCLLALSVVDIYLLPKLAEYTPLSQLLISVKQTNTGEDWLMGEGMACGDLSFSDTGCHVPDVCHNYCHWYNVDIILMCLSVYTSRGCCHPRTSFKIRIELAATELPCIVLIFPTSVFSRAVSGCMRKTLQCSGRGLTTCPCMWAQLLANLLKMNWSQYLKEQGKFLFII